MDDVLFSTGGSTEWETPKDFFQKINHVFKFTVDVCATKENTKCKRYFTPEVDGLAQDWTGTVWCNPPYGHDVVKWVKKAHESHKQGTTIVPCWSVSWPNSMVTNCVQLLNPFASCSVLCSLWGF